MAPAARGAPSLSSTPGKKRQEPKAVFRYDFIDDSRFLEQGAVFPPAGHGQAGIRVFPADEADGRERDQEVAEPTEESFT